MLNGGLPRDGRRGGYHQRPVDRVRRRPAAPRGPGRARCARSVSSLMTPSSRSRMTASRWATSTAARMARWSSSSCSASSSVVPARRTTCSASCSRSSRSWSMSGRWSGIVRAQRRRAAGGPPRRRPDGRASPRPRRPRPRRRHPQLPDQPRQGQALPDERGQDDAEGQVQDEGALREVRRQGQRGRQRDDAAHAGPRDDDDGPGGGAGSLLADASRSAAAGRSPGRPTRSA